MYQLLLHQPRFAKLSFGAKRYLMRNLFQIQRTNLFKVGYGLAVIQPTIYVLTHLKS